MTHIGWARDAENPNDPSPIKGYKNQKSPSTVYHLTQTSLPTNLASDTYPITPSVSLSTYTSATSFYARRQYHQTPTPHYTGYTSTQPTTSLVALPTHYHRQEPRATIGQLEIFTLREERTLTFLRLRIH